MGTSSPTAKYISLFRHSSYDSRNSIPLLSHSPQHQRHLLSLQPHLLSSQTPLHHPNRRTMASAMGRRLEGKTVVVTGASSGIGKSTALEFARTSPKSLKLVLTARRIDALKQLAEEIKKEVGDGVKVHPVQLDVSQT